MADRVLTLDELCAVLTDAFRATNASLASQPLPEAGSSVPPFSYRMPHETKYKLRTIPYSAFYSRHRYRLRQMAFSLPCCVAVRRSPSGKQTVLSLRAPAWWKRIGRALVCKRIDIDVFEDGMTLRFGPGTLAQLPRKGKRWILLLTLEQQAALSEPSGSAAQASSVANQPAAPGPTEPAAARFGYAILSRIARWLHIKWPNDAS